MLTRDGYPFFRCKTIWEVNDAIDKKQDKESNSQEYGDIDSGGISAETSVCDCPQCSTEEQEA
jgi:hypothetical protein